MLLDNILDGALMYDINMKEGEEAGATSRKINNHSVDSDLEINDASGLVIKYTNSTLRNLFKNIIEQ
jgi:hypothetical protein